VKESGARRGSVELLGRPFYLSAHQAAKERGNLRGCPKKLDKGKDTSK